MTEQEFSFIPIQKRYLKYCESKDDDIIYLTLSRLGNLPVSEYRKLKVSAHVPKDKLTLEGEVRLIMDIMISIERIKVTPISFTNVREGVANLILPFYQLLNNSI